MEGQVKVFRHDNRNNLKGNFKAHKHSKPEWLKQSRRKQEKPKPQSKSKHQLEFEAQILVIKYLAPLKFDFRKSTHILLFTLCWLVSRSNARAETSKLISTKMRYHPGVSKVECDKIVSVIEKAAANKAYDTTKMLYVLNKIDFKIECIKQKNQSDATAHYNPNNNSIKCYERFLPSSQTIRHEFIHAFWWNYHGNSQKCKVQSSLAAIAPVFPRNDNEIAKYNAALDGGDKELKNFLGLIKKNKNNQLSQQEKILFDTYMDSFSKALPYEGYRMISEKTYKVIESNQYDPSQLKSAIKGNFKGIVKANGKHLVIVSYENIEDLITYIELSLDNVHSQYKNSDPLLQIAERDANTFSYFTKAAVDLFYKKADKMRSRYIERCKNTNSGQHEKNTCGLK